MKTIISAAFLIWVGFSSSYAEPESVRFSLGSNIWGNTLGIGYQHGLGKKWALGVMFSSGYFSLVKNEAGDFLLPKYLPGDEHRVTLELKQLIDVSVCYKRNDKPGIKYFDEFAIGITHAFFTFKSEYTEVGTRGTFQGQRDYSLYGLFLSCNVVRFELKSPDKMFLLLGIRSKFIVLDSPQEIDYDNGAGIVRREKLYCINCDHIIYPYPEIFATISVGL
jgi:hypothetical protein